MPAIQFPQLVLSDVISSAVLNAESHHRFCALVMWVGIISNPPITSRLTSCFQVLTYSPPPTPACLHFSPLTV